MKSKVTVIIPNYNGGAYLRDAVDSLLKQTYSPWEAVIVDDASTDDSLEQIEDLLADRRIRIVRNKVNIGHGKTMNVGLAHTDTPYVVQLDADDWFFPYSLGLLVTEMDKQPEHVGLVSGNMNIVYENLFGLRNVSCIVQNRSFRDKYEFLLSNLSQWPRFVRTSALREIGGWPNDDPYEGRHLEDRSMLLHLIENYHFKWIDIPVYNYRRHGGNKTNNLEKYSEVIDWTTRAALKRWGDEYEPVYHIANNWRFVVGFLPKKKEK